MSARRTSVPATRQRGNVSLIVALSSLALLGFAGIAVDAGRMFVNKTELQTAADACALAAAAELTCDVSGGGVCAAAYLQNAEAAGIFVAGRSRRDFQSTAVVIAPADVRFSTALAPNANYLSRTAGAPTNSRYAMCIARFAGLVPWFMTLLGAPTQTVQSAGVATRAPAQTSCPNAPIGLCSKPGGYVIGEWIPATFQTNGNNDTVTGGFKWVEYTATSVIRDQLAGQQTVCGVRTGDTVTTQGTHQGAKTAYNSRFGIYPNGANAYTPQTAPPDHTGYSYPNKAPGSPVIPIGTSAYADYRSRQGADTPFTSNEYGVSGPGGNFSGNPSTAATHRTLGTERRLITGPIIDCAAGNSPPILSMACMLMLNPMSNGANGTIYLEYRGNTTLAGSPCRTSGLPGGPASTGVQVPVLVQ
ncbi:MAG TPA: pilus assembly protein TadG-related protein [Albitalea sp.]|uniref:pilus assembly protein TadG-related protein n=1 Tax=Piscinibacter sp. TaxID=1903157 RepID=UPI002ED2C125